MQMENDAVSTLKGTSDQYYTSGVRLGYTSGTDGVPGFLDRFGHTVWGDGVQRVSIDLSQSVFTPRNTQINPADPKDRPYAGYLRISGALIHDDDDSRSVLGISLGVVGPAALAEQSQNSFHSLIGNPSSKGWGGQLKNEPAFELLGERTFRLPVAQFSGLEVDALPAITAGVGTVRDYVQTGIALRLGQGLGSDFGAPRIRPGFSGGDAYTPTQPFAWYVFAGVDGQAIARDEFLDGSAFISNGPHVQRVPFVGEIIGGAAIMLYGVRLTYTQTWQTTSFKGQKGGMFNFGSIAGSVRF
jgi:lipid A 3-O-deacylase